MPIATITSKGQITIPKSVRDRLRLKAGDRLEYVVQKDGTVLMIPMTVHVDKLEGILPPPRKPVSIEDMNRAIREGGGKP